MNIVYYIEVNVICIIMLLLVKIQLRSKERNYSTSEKIFNYLLYATIILCSSDMIAGICRGKFFFGARALIEISNIIFYESMAIISYLWMRYVYVSLDNLESNRATSRLYSIPLLLFSLVALFEPFTNFLFYIDSNNLFVRNVGTPLHWMITWMYFAIATIKVIVKIIKEKNAVKRKQITPYLYFIIAPFIGGLVQMLFYGVTSTQVGISFSIIMVFLEEQRTRIATDTLTGLYNRRALNSFIKNNILNNTNNSLQILMIDIDHFKSINDNYGHIVGDKALIDVARILNCALKDIHKKAMICRYGGDEFVIVSFDCVTEEMKIIKNNIYAELEKHKANTSADYELWLSIGFAYGKCVNDDDFEKIIISADENMYIEKNNANN